MSQAQDPEAALLQFRQAQHLVPARHPDRGLAAYDAAMALYLAGAYRQSADAFRSLLSSPTLRGYDPHHAALWLRHAAACAGYHEERARQGIPEPPRLDPLCGAAALAACLRARHLPADRKSVLAACRVTGRGSTLQDILAAGKKLGVSVRAVTADDRGLQALPLPAVAYVEHDHFIAVVQADPSGVSYLCSDCGPWPGGKVTLTWKQWHALDATAYVVVTRKDSPSDRWLRLALGAVPGGKARTGADRPWKLADLHRTVPPPTALLMHLIALQAGYNTHCGFPNNSLQCPCYIQCPWECPGWGLVGALGGDPINLASGEEELKAPTDLVVYNPHGPPVVWQREFESLRGYDPFYEYDDFGFGWTQPYNFGVFDPTVGQNPQLLLGKSVSVTPNGSDAPTNGYTWDIVLNGQLVANGNIPAGWNVAYSSGSLTITVPANASPVTGYEARYHSGTVTVSVTFDVLPPATVPEGMGPVPVPVNGADKPVSPAQWDIVYNGKVIASSLTSGSWNVTNTTVGGTNCLNVAAPSTAATGPGYEARYYLAQAVQSPDGRTRRAVCGWRSGTGTGPYSATFSISGSRCFPLAGTKYIVEANGARISFSASAVPTAANPQVACSVGAGVPMQITWNYDTGSPFGTYTVLLPDRTQWTTTYVSQLIYNPTQTLTKTISASYSLGKLTDRNGNSLKFWYGAPGATGFPLLSSISDGNNSGLLSITRATDGTGNIVSVTDCYGRSIYYHESSYPTQNVPVGYPQQFQELDHVSQVVATGTANPPDRVAYGYTNVTNNEGEGVVGLVKITVPSPTGGSGTVTATLNYQANTGYVSSVVDGNGNTRSYNFVDNSHNQVTITDATNTVIYRYTAGFDANMSATTLTDGAYNTVVNLNNPNLPPTYPNTNVIRASVFGDANNPYRPSVVYDGNGYAVNGAGGLGKSQFTWDRYGHCLTATSPYGTTTTFTWSYATFPLGELTRVQEGAKSPTTFTYYEPSGNIQQVTVPQPGTTGSNQTVSYKATWSALGNLLTLTTPGNPATVAGSVDQGITTTYSYGTSEALGEPTTITDNLGKSVHLGYNPRGQVTSAVDALGNEVDTGYYLSGQVQTVTLPATGQSGVGRGYTAYSYLYPGGPLTNVAVYDEGSLGLIRQYVPLYGKEGELLSVSGSLNGYSLSYDGMYRVKELVSGNGGKTDTTYDAAGHVTQVSLPNGDAMTALSWDHNDQVLTATNGRGQSLGFVYQDNESRLTLAQGPGVSNAYAFDGYGRLSSVTDANGARTYSYDDDDLPGSQTINDNGVASLFSLSYHYNNDGSRSSLGLSNAVTGLNLSFGYSYNGRGELTSLTNPYGEAFSWTYLDNGWLSSQRSANAATTSFTYNALGQLLDLSNKTIGNSVLSDFNMSGSGHYDGAGNLLGLTASLPGAPAAYSGTTAMQYDGKDQLTSEQSGRLGGYTNGFGYDGNSNPTTFKGVAQTFNTADQNQASTFDHDGNPTSWQGNALSFDSASNLTALGSLLTAGYNAEGLRTWKQTASGKTFFLYDGLVPIAEVDGNANVLAVNTWGVNGLASRRTLSTNSSVFYTFDVQGGTAQRLDANGNILGSYGFDAYGTRASTDNSSDPYSGYGAQWGYYRDSETGLHLLGKRYYDVGQGRFLNRDPIGYEGGLNLYAYAGSSPSYGPDPSGEFIPILVGAVGLGLLIFGTLVDSEQPAGEPNPFYHHTTPNHDFMRSLLCDLPEFTPSGEIRRPDIWGAPTPPMLPPKVIAAGRGVRIVHNYHDPLPGTPQDHGPAHAHVTGGGPETRIGPRGHAMFGDPEPTPVQRAVIRDSRNQIRRALNKAGKWLEYMEAAAEEAAELD